MGRPSLAGRASARALRWGVGLAIGALVVGVGGAYVAPYGAQAFVWGLRLLIDGVLWLALSISSGTDLWTIAGAAGRAVTTSLVTPQAIGGTGVLLVVSAVAVWALRRLFQSGKESVR